MAANMMVLSVELITLLCVAVCMWGGPVAQWLRAPPADEEFLRLNPTATTLSGLPRHEMTSAVNVALNNHSN